VPLVFPQLRIYITKLFSIMTNISTKRVLTGYEEELIGLRKKHGTVKKRVTTERSKLDRFKEDIRRVMSESSGAMQRAMQEFHKAQSKMQSVLEQCAQSKIFSKRERSDFHWMKEDLREMFNEQMPQMTEEEIAEFVRKQAEERQNSGWDFMNRFTPPVSEAEQRSIREVYKRLAAQFHPDKSAGNVELERRFNSIMQRINAAYQRGDIADLLDIETEFANVADILAHDESPLAELVEREIERVKEELALCAQQLERLKSERKSLEKSHDGRMVKDFLKATKIGIDPIEQITAETETAVQEMNRQTSMFERVLSGEITKEQFYDEMDRDSRQQMPVFVGDTDMEITEEDLMSILEQLVGMEMQRSKHAPPRTQSSSRQSSKANQKPSNKKTWQQKGRGKR
jgi:archaellum component FlaC